MYRISSAEFERIVCGIEEDRDVIVRSNPIGSRGEIMLWMLLGCLVSYLGLDETETPCFPGRPSEETYAEAISFVLNGRKSEEFDETAHIERLRSL